MWSCKFYKFRQVKYLAPLIVKPLDIELYTDLDFPPGYDYLTLERTLSRIVQCLVHNKNVHKGQILWKSQWDSLNPGFDKFETL